MRTIFLLLLLIFASQIRANDGVFYSDGSNLIPVNETRIELRKEVLTLKLTDKGMLVNVYFEFYNPDGERIETVGFVTPPSSEEYWQLEIDSSKYTEMHPRIQNFIVLVNDSILPYKIHRLNKSGFQFRDNLYRNEIDYVYHFQMKFKPGLNIIRHSYIFEGGANMGARTFFYRLTTGKSWANKEISDFQLNLDIPDNLLSVPLSFYEKGPDAQWELFGIGRLSSSKNLQDGSKFRQVYVKNGILQYKALHFKPDYDLELILSSDFFWLFGSESKIPEQYELWEKIGPLIMTTAEYREEYLTNLNDEELQLLINIMYARGGYAFKSEKQMELFSPYLWYIPDPNTTPQTLDLNPDQKSLLEDLVKERTARVEKKQTQIQR